MDCYLCGKDIGDNLGTCEECRKKADDERNAEYEALTAESDPDAWDGEIRIDEVAELVSNNKKAVGIGAGVFIAVALLGITLFSFVSSSIAGHPIKQLTLEAIQRVPDYEKNQSYYDLLLSNAFDKAAKDQSFISAKTPDEIRAAAELLVDYMIDQADDEERSGIAHELENVIISEKK